MPKSAARTRVLGVRLSDGEWSDLETLAGERMLSLADTVRALVREERSREDRIVALQLLALARRAGGIAALTNAMYVAEDSRKGRPRGILIG